VRSLDYQEQAIFNQLKSDLGLSGGANKKSKDLIAMKRKQKGGQLGETTDPTNHHYSAILANGFVSEKMQQCEGAHFANPEVDGELGLEYFPGANTNTPQHVRELEKCLVDKLYDGIPDDIRPADKLDTIATVSERPLSMPFAGTGKCTTDKGIAFADKDISKRVNCGTLTGYSSSARKLSDPNPLKSDLSFKLKYYDKDGKIPEGGSRKRKSRSPSIKSSSPSRMARKSTRRATRRSTVRKTSRKGNRKTRRSCRK